MEENGKCQSRSLTVCWHSGVSGQGSWEEPSRLTWTLFFISVSCSSSAYLPLVASTVFYFDSFLKEPPRISKVTQHLLSPPHCLTDLEVTDCYK